MNTSSTTRRFATPLLSVALLFSLAFVAPNESHAAKRKTHAQRSGGKIKFDKGSGETTQERDRRLLRECKGRPNSGACMGYTG